jgi:Transport protein particle (TRAPP) component
MYFRLEPLGFRVGQGIAERFSRDRPRFTDNMDVIKFLCKDLWTILFRKQIDNLKTNHRVCCLGGVDVGCICINGQQFQMVFSYVDDIRVPGRHQ